MKGKCNSWQSSSDHVSFSSIFIRTLKGNDIKVSLGNYDNGMYDHWANYIWPTYWINPLLYVNINIYLYTQNVNSWSIYAVRFSSFVHEVYLFKYYALLIPFVYTTQLIFFTLFIRIEYQLFMQSTMCT